MRLAEKLGAAGIECRRVHFPKGMDANAYAMKVAPAAKSLGVLLRHAHWIGKGAAPARLPTSEPTIAESPAEHAAPSEARHGSDLPAAADAVPEPASPLAADPPLSAASPATEIPTEVKPEEVIIRLGDRKYRVRGLAKNLSYEQLRVNVLCARGESSTSTPSISTPPASVRSSSSRRPRSWRSRRT